VPEVRHPQVLAYDQDGRLFPLLKPFREEARWAVRSISRLESCLDPGGSPEPTVLVMKPGRKPEKDMATLERLTGHDPNLQAVVIVEENQAGLAALAWDLGAAFVLFPPQVPVHLQEVVRGLMQLAIERQRTAMGQVKPIQPDSPSLARE
jgi:hypothetical protein